MKKVIQNNVIPGLTGKTAYRARSGKVVYSLVPKKGIPIAMIGSQVKGEVLTVEEI